MSEKKKPPKLMSDAIRESMERLKSITENPLMKQVTALRDQATAMPQAMRAVEQADMARATRGGITREMLAKVTPRELEPRAIPEVFRDAFPKTSAEELADNVRDVQRQLDLMTKRIDELVTAFNGFTEAVTAAVTKRDRGELAGPKKTKKGGAN